MAEKAEPEVVEQTETKEEETGAAALAAGFDPATPPVVTTEAPAEPVAEQPVPEEYVQITKKDLDRLIAAADKTEAHAAQFDKVFGTVGNMQQVVNRLQAATPAGEAVEASEEDIAELAADFPDLAGQIRTTLNRVLKRVNAKGTGEEPATLKAPTADVDPDKLRPVVSAETHRLQLEELDDLHPGWRDIVGKPDEADKPFRKWMATQPQEYQDKINNTQSAAITSRAIDKFRAAEKAAVKPAAVQPARPAEARRAAIQAAVQPRGTGTKPGPHTPTPEENLNAGFNS